MSTAPAPASSAGLPLQHEAAYRALRTRDARFDGRLFVGVTSTGIYCRPVCRVRPPRQENCRFFDQAAQAEAAGFRPCLRCRPELAPGLSLTDSSDMLAAQAARMLTQAVQDGLAGDDRAGALLPAIAARLGVTDRHLRRIFQRAHGVTPLAWLTTQRLLLAKQLLTDTRLPVSSVALAAGFGSQRRFNDAFAAHYRMPPTRLRGAAEPSAAPATPGDAATLWLAYRPPYDLPGLLAFAANRALPGIEHVDAARLSIARTLAVEHGGQRLAGWLQARFVPERSAVQLQLSPSLLPAAGSLLARCRQALDLDADPERIAEGLDQADPPPGPPRPGVRLPGAWDGFEAAVRVVLGQQVTVAAARTLTRRLVERFGTPLPDAAAAPAGSGLAQLFPGAAAIAAADPADLGTLGIVRQRVRALQALATALAEGRLRLDRSAALEPTLAALTALPGIGDWSAQLIAMRALAWPDAWPASDIGLLNALIDPQRFADRPRHRPDAAQAAALAESWRPWRAYAVMRLWLTLEN
ncbi:MAG: DNA-3-methyladenine glycosylase 2 family protein [Burkholderiaceae bacterium]|nr:DNA-3-methyladenine glycosylase 2 family protein [Burkholderiaceae bacterium]